nr:PLP-dependent aminotransferase family protein [Streptomyces sp. HPF1205]
MRAQEAPRGGLSGWLAARMRQAIADGRIAVGSRLPPSRVLAAELRVSRGAVTEAYRRLADDGHVAGRGRAGTVVVAAPAAGRAPLREPGAGGRPPAGRACVPPVPPYPRVPTGAGLFTPEPGTEVFEALRSAPARIDLSPGVPDLGAFPRAAWLRAEREVLGATGAGSLGYGDPRGTPELRRAVVDWLARYRGIAADPEDVVVVSGTAQALTLLGQVLAGYGHGAIAVEEPGSLGARQHLRRVAGATPPVPVDGEGLRVDALRACGAGAVLVTPAHQFPTGVVLSGARRRELMEWAAGGGLIVEDDYDAEHRYDRAPVAALKAALPERVCYAGSVSKVLAPALRTGWVLAPRPYHEALVEAKRFADLGNPALPQLVLARLMESGALERQLRVLRQRHRRRRDAMTAAVAAHLPGAVVHGAAAGLHLTVAFPEGGFRDLDLATASLDRGIKVHPLSWHRQRPGPPGLVLGYAGNTPDLVTEAVATVGAALAELSAGA